MEGFGIRAYEARDQARVLALNNAAVPATNELTTAMLQEILDECHHTLVVEAVDGARVVGVLIAVLPGKKYDSANYVWFSAKFELFGYVDRIVVDPAVHGKGIGQGLYNRYKALCRDAGVPRVCCEVNTRPRNEQSLAFHDKFGFRPVGEQETEGGSKTVVMLELPVA
jgi:predicted GNAT superfamily acetyltransferase